MDVCIVVLTVNLDLLLDVDDLYHVGNSLCVCHSVMVKSSTGKVLDTTPATYKTLGLRVRLVVIWNLWCEYLCQR